MGDPLLLGDLEAFIRRLHRSYEGRQMGEVEDHLNEAYKRALVGRGQFRLGSSGLPWMMTIARRVVWDDLKASSRERREPGGFDLETYPDPDRRGEDERIEAVAEALTTLSPRRRRVVWMRHVEGKSCAEIARIEGLTSAKAATDETCRGMKELRPLLGYSRSRRRRR